MKFNLKTFAKKQSQDDHEPNERRLRKEHSDAPEEVTQKQLDRDRVPEKEVTIEKLLDDKRIGGADKITEKNLDDSDSKLHQHRNSSAHDGDINKVEEQRISKEKAEDEKAKPASETPSKKRWWEDLKASSQKRTVTAQESLTFDEEERWGRVPGAWTEEEGVMTDDQFADPDDFAIEEIGVEPLTVDEIKPVSTPAGKGLLISFEVNPEAQMGVSELQDAAYNKTLEEGYGYLASVEGFIPDQFRLRDGKMIARLFGDEYYPTGKGDYEEEGLVEDQTFTVSELQPTSVEGVMLGSISVDPEMLSVIQDMDDEEIKNKVLSAISEKHEMVSVEPAGIDLDDLSSGKISFVGEMAVKKRGPKTESWENVKGEPIASSEFDIVVLSDTKKN